MEYLVDKQKEKKKKRYLLANQQDLPLQEMDLKTSSLAMHRGYPLISITRNKEPARV